MLGRTTEQDCPIGHTRAHAGSPGNRPVTPI